MTETGRGTGQRLTDEQRIDWLRLIRSESVGPLTFRSLVNRFGGASNALEALPGLLAERGKSIRIPPRGEIEREIERATQLGAVFVAMGEPDYPKRLAAIPAAPPVICMKGRVDLASRPSLAMVGARNASGTGLLMAERLAGDLGRAGFVIVSGLARGIDTKAHIAALPTGTVAVFAGGLDHIYPSENRALAERMAVEGCLLSEMPLGWEPRSRDFPGRNRIVSGLAFGVVVVEAARRSGSLITTRFALEQGREVFAVPGSPLDPRAEGANDLLRDGANLATSAEDIVRVIEPLMGREPPPEGVDEDPYRREPQPLWDELDLFAGDEPAFAEKDTVVLDVPAQEEPPPERRDPAAVLTALMGPSPMPVDALIRLSGLSPATVNATLVDLDLAGRIERHGSGLVSLR